MFRVTKTYGHNLGFSTNFRQWRASSHCRFLHGYALQFELIFEAPRLNDNNWVIDFGSLKPVKKWLEETFDHKTLVAHDDPALQLFQDMNLTRGERRSDDLEVDWDESGRLIQMIVVPAVGCEGFAKHVADNTLRILRENENNLQGGADNGVKLYSVEAREHPGNSATYVCNTAISTPAGNKNDDYR
jgi:6-pyruvoyltetrahydropterin/6-carboxytetrahydropterin synthase